MEVVVTEYIKQENTEMHTVNWITKMKTLVLLLLGAIVAQAKDERSYVYECRAFADSYFNGVYHDFNEPVPYLDSYDFDNTIESARVTGVWLFYDNVEYNTYESGMVHYSWGLDYSDTFDGVHNRVSSLRYAGSQLVINENGYNLYHGTYYTGKHLYETNDIPDLTVFHQDVTSIIIIGQSSWTFCEGTYYTGNCQCLYATQYDQNTLHRLDVGFYPTIHDYPVGLSQVMSVHQGCGGGGGRAA
ncbi:uncharacterized protein LOC127001526 [Eriocheir sinensis]|uniref:uncharacterized protein LOC127001526 n=1 Tax=Eriocheir sinensis TaxID=95602 RepID=UPI0021C5D3AA|nr:uncharacterized protein LOC127001526 [Eriocheir sinensis]